MRKPAIQKASKPAWKVKLMCIDDDGEANLVLPFVPFIGLKVQVPFWRDEFHPIDDIFWYSDEQRFDCFVELPDDK